MDTVGKLIAAALLCSVICLLLKKQAPELTLCLCVLVCALCFLTSFPFFSPILASSILKILVFILYHKQISVPRYILHKSRPIYL